MNLFQILHHILFKEKRKKKKTKIKNTNPNPRKPKTEAENQSKTANRANTEANISLYSMQELGSIKVHRHSKVK